jgi:hypothetical protein
MYVWSQKIDIKSQCTAALGGPDERREDGTKKNVAYPNDEHTEIINFNIVKKSDTTG